MGTVEKISIALTPDMAAVVRKAVESGGYASNSEVIREALRDWQNKQWLREKQLEELRRLIQEGIDSGSAGEWSLEEFMKEAGRRYATKQAQEKP